MRFAYVKNASNPRYVAKHLHHTNGCSNFDEHDVIVDGSNFDRDFTAIPHIRDPRTNRNGPKYI